MTIYVESNFVLEIALEQEQSDAAEAILRRAERSEIGLALPSFSLSEPFSTITKRSRDRAQLASQLRNQLRELGRTKSLEGDLRSLELAPTILARIEEKETDGLVQTVRRLLNVATIIQVDASVFEGAIAYRGQFELSTEDALIYATVISHLSLSQSADGHMFVNKNWRHFSIPSIAADLARLNCQYLESFDDAALRLEQPPLD